jgi:alkylation response protein AidB-like acyl-CoA dehydrogenase
MNFGFSPQEESFREEVKEFIRKEFPSKLRWDFGCTFTPAVQSHEGEEWEYVKAMRRKVGAKGWLSLSWPEEYGGKNSLFLQNIVFEEILYHNVPGVDHIGVTFFAPTLLRFGTEKQKRQYLPGIASGDKYWCELLSEPDSGSDLASLKTQAIEDGDYYIINGQKTWNSGAHKTQMGFILVRTDSTLPRHKGLSYFIVDMTTPGITIRPIINMVGEHEFNEVFFDNVKVPKENLVGGKNRGWSVTMMTLDFERFSHMMYPSIRGYLDGLVEYLKQNGKSLEPLHRNQLYQLFAECEMAKMIHYRAMCIMTKGTPTTYEVAIDKMYNCELAQRAADFGTQVLGHYGQLRRGSKFAPLNGWPSFYYLDAASYTMMGGTSEIDRNVIATQGLGLPVQ